MTFSKCRKMVYLEKFQKHVESVTGNIVKQETWSVRA